jgi:hypothetical protein
MRTLRTFVLIFLIAASSLPAITQNLPSMVQGPILGFAHDAPGQAIWPILGIPGASALGDRLKVNQGFRNAVLSPKQNYAIAVAETTGEVVLVRLDGASITVTPLGGARPGGDVLAISPTGTAAGVYSQSSGILQLIGQLPNVGQTVYEINTSNFSGRLIDVAVSDDGTAALVSAAEGATTGLWFVNSGGALWRLPSASPSAIAFFANRHDGIVGDDTAREVFLLLGLDDAASRVPLVTFNNSIAGFSGVAASEDGRRVFIAGRASRTVAVVDVQTRTATVVACSCQPAGLYRLKGSGVFRLTDPMAGAVAVLDASSAQPRIVMIPADPRMK